MIELLNIDCMEYMATLPDKAFDLAVVDPPYGINIGKTTNTKGKNRIKRTSDKYIKKDWDNQIPNAEYWIYLKRVSKNQIVFGANYFVEYLNKSKGWFFWNKKNACPSFSDGEFVYTSFNKVAKMFTLSSVFDCNSGIDRFHPTQKPVALYKWLLHNYAKPGDRILDTHLGSGSSAIAAHNMGFDFVGCELDKDYYDAACKRFKEQTKQLSLL
jgi:site-specific DNA-methyltransferase (adenine-specific)